jgi:hypothetical protein
VPVRLSLAARTATLNAHLSLCAALSCTDDGAAFFNRQVVVLPGVGYNPFRLTDGSTPFIPSGDCSRWGEVTLGDSFAFFSWFYAAFDTVLKIFMTFSSVDDTEGSGRTTKDTFTSMLPIIAHIALIVGVFFKTSAPANPVGAMLMCGIVFSSMGLRLVLSMKYHPEAEAYVRPSLACISTSASPSFGLGFVFRHFLFPLQAK